MQKAIALAPKSFDTYVRHRTPWMRPEDHEHMLAGLRKAGGRTIPRLRRRIGSFARNLTAREAANYFRHAGYA